MAAKHIGLIANLDKPGAVDLLRRLKEDFVAEGHQVSCTKEAATAAGFAGDGGHESLDPVELARACELLVVLGGDGTLLHVASQLREHAKPLAAINTGTLGFLTCATSHETERLVSAISDGSYEISKRRILSAEVRIGDQPPETYTALNELVVGRGTTSRTVHVESRVDGAFVNHYSGDGLIVATPTGSTAYSMSAGGPIIHPSAGVLVITPVCPHTLANRAIIVDDRSEIDLLIPEQRDPLYLTVDGKAIAEINHVTQIRITRAEFDLPLVMLADASFFNVLKAKLGWYGSSVRKGDEQDV